MAFDAIADTCIGRQQLVFRQLANQHILNVISDGNLVVDFQYTLGSSSVLRQVDVRHRFDIGKQVLALVVRNVAIHIAQFLFYQVQALIDKHGSTHHDLVLVLKPVVVVDGNQHIDEIVGSLLGDVLNNEGHDVGVFVGQANTQSGTETACSAFETEMLYMDNVIVCAFLVIIGRFHTNEANGRANSVTQFGRHFS